MKTITIIRNDNGDLEIVDGDKTTQQLTIGEVLEMVIKQIYDDIPGPRYPMMTREEWANRFHKPITDNTGDSP